MSKTIGSARQRALADFLVARREALGLSQTDLANSLGQYQSFVARLESGERRVDVVEFIELSEILAFDAAAAVSAIKKVRR